MTVEITNRDGIAVGACQVRSSCVVCGAPELSPALVIPNAPVYMGCTDGSVKDDAFADQCWEQCAKCGCIQLTSLPPLELVYLFQHNAAIGGTWKRHHEAFAQFIAKGAPQNIVEVGGATGALARIYVDRHPVERWTVVEPNPTFSPEGRVHLEQAYIEDVPRIVAEADAVIHSHLFEHLYKPTEFLESIRGQMAEGAPMILSVPDLSSLLAGSGSNALNFEHTFYFATPTLEWMLNIHGFELEKLERFEHHSIFMLARAQGVPERTDPPPDTSSGAREFADFVDATRQDAKDLATKADAFTGPVYLFGAHVFSQFLLSCGFPESNVAGILDNDSAKQGRRLYGSGLSVHSPALISDASPAAVIVRASHYTDEIKEQLLGVSDKVEIW